MNIREMLGFVTQKNVSRVDQAKADPPFNKPDIFEFQYHRIDVVGWVERK